MTLPEAVEKKLEALPPRPGCYVFRDDKGEALYIGKAKSLRSRVKSYFVEAPSDTRSFLPLLHRHVADLETFVTSTEKEAAILENNLIKESHPRYNVKLRDDKEFLTLRMSLDHEWPRLELVRLPDNDGAEYFGPYHSATAARRTLGLVEKHFQLRTCSDRELVSRKRPCLQFQIKRCPAPCVYEVDKDMYAQQVHAVSLFLAGRHDELSTELEKDMNESAENMEYELAAMYRDQLRAVTSIRQSQRVLLVTDRDQDVLGLYREGDRVELALLNVRSGRVIDATTFSMKSLEIPDDELVAAFLRDHYQGGGAMLPDEVLLHVLPDAAEGVAEWLTDTREARALGGRVRKVELVVPARGKKKELLELAMDNAKHAFLEKQRTAEDMGERLARLQQKLRLPTLPRRIECVDISHLGGLDTVGGVVAVLDGVADKKRYRTYKVRTTTEGDDYAAMYEVLARRFRRGRTAEEGTSSDEKMDWDLPDLFVVDGGRGQLAVALAAASDLGLHDLPIVGLAKERETPLGEKMVDRVYLPGQKNPINLKRESAELFILARARDEAHRFANRGRKKVGKKRRFESELDSIAGIGPKTRSALLQTLGSLTRLKQASDDEILAVPGVSKKHLQALREYFGPASVASTPADASTPDSKALDETETPSVS